MVTSHLISFLDSTELRKSVSHGFAHGSSTVLGLPFDAAIDIWSIGCTLYELYTGKILFPGRSNNHMLLLMMEVKGKINHRLIKKAAFGEMYFDEGMNFLSVEKDKITGAVHKITTSIGEADSTGCSQDTGHLRSISRYPISHHALEQYPTQNEGRRD
jgi:serine/threonine protein kinase